MVAKIDKIFARIIDIIFYSARIQLLTIQEDSKMEDLKQAKEEMKKWLRDNKNAVFGIEGRLSASFNRFVKKEFPVIYQFAKNAASTSTRTHCRYSPDCVYTWVHYKPEFQLGEQDPYPKAPNMSVLTAETAWRVACKIESGELALS